MRGVSIVIPMYNAETHISRVLDAIYAQDYRGPVEVIVVNDGSTDRSPLIVEDYAAKRPLRIINQKNSGAVTATNNGFAAAKSDFICSVDSDVVLHRDWLARIMEEFDDPGVGAVQGYYKTPSGVSFWARLMGYDVEKRYDEIKGKYVSQVCTGDTAYRKAAVESTGFFDPDFRYGYDNDMSYRLAMNGYKLVIRKDALCDHYWKEDFKGYVRQQYYSAYGRMQLVSKHRNKIMGDSVSGLRMILQVPLTLLFSALIISGTICMLAGGSSSVLTAGLILFFLFLAERVHFSVPIARKHRDWTAFFLPLVHFVRNVVWCAAFLHWNAKMLLFRIKS